ncbi:hypothetical protein [Simiduia aestuariiviva]|uniref:Lipoprotein n=1 Tax=Simiduia aestuariiviva TaxID=1510459 RepID=A0A839UK12_9GAMM|nr:hypothetical protein [Simiduia aestuariiviva]MBB3166950.1 hypothetical protein [Simiduia aestuariiviva]
MKNIVSILALAMPAISLACSCGDIDDETNFRDASKIFIGRISEGRNHNEPYSLDVIKVYKGSVSDREFVFLGNGNGDCGLGHDKQSDYLIYLQDDNRANICTGSVRASSVLRVRSEGVVKINHFEESYLIELNEKEKNSNK